MSARTACLAFLDHIATGIEAAIGNWPLSPDLWTIIDAAADEGFENDVKGQYLSNLDTELQRGGAWTSTNQCMVARSIDETYLGARLGYTTNPRLNAWLAAQAVRVSARAAVAYGEAVGGTVSALYAFPPGIRPASGSPAASGMHLFGTYTATSTWTASAGALPATQGPAGVLCINSGSSQTVAGTFRCTNYVAPTTYKDLALSLSSAAQYTQTILGQQAVASGAAAGQATVAVAATTQFTANEWVLIHESDALQEVAQVSSISADASLTMKTALVNSYTTAAVVIPLFASAAYQSSGSGSGAVLVYALPDRSIGYYTA